MQFPSNISVPTCTSSNADHLIKSSCTYVHLCLFHSKLLQYSTWCQNRGCSYISSTRRIYRSNPAVSCISSSILNKVEYNSTNSSKKGGRSHPASIFRAVLPSRISILSGSRLSQLPVQGPREGSPCFQCILCSSAPPAGSPVCSRVCCSRRGFLLLILY